MAKNAWSIDDRVAVERNWRLALDEARRASALDPQDTHAAGKVADLQSRLDQFLASRPEPQVQNRSTQPSGTRMGGPR
jgi:hypothetical protein